MKSIERFQQQPIPPTLPPNLPPTPSPTRDIVCSEGKIVVVDKHQDKHCVDRQHLSKGLTLENIQDKINKGEENKILDFESFVNMPNKNVLDLNLLLKSLLFACLFYILAHGDTTKMIKPIVGKLGNKNMDIVLMVLFVILYYVISLFI